MGVDSYLYLPPATRLRDFGNVVATLLGHPTRFVDHGNYESCVVDGVSVEPSTDATCANVNLSGPGGARYKYLLWQYESDGVNRDPAGDAEHGGWHVVLMRANPLNIALAHRLACVFGGIVIEQDHEPVIAADIKPSRLAYPNDGDPWKAWQREMSEVKPLTIAEIDSYRDRAAYRDTVTVAPWLAFKAPGPPKVQIEIRTTESGGRWLPAVHGTLNQTGWDDERASTFDSESLAEATAAEEPLASYLNSDSVLAWRIVSIKHEGK